MKTAQLELDGEPLQEVVMVMDPKEVLIVHTAVKEFCEKNKRNKKAAKLLADLDIAGIFF